MITFLCFHQNVKLFSWWSFLRCPSNHHFSGLWRDVRRVVVRRVLTRLWNLGSLSWRSWYHSILSPNLKTGFMVFSFVLSFQSSFLWVMKGCAASSSETSTHTTLKLRVSNLIYMSWRSWLHSMLPQKIKTGFMVFSFVLSFQSSFWWVMKGCAVMCSKTSTHTTLILRVSNLIYMSGRSW